ncbi:nucleoid-associated protein [uncultured Chryseobacterium sp.]|uniref:nucleoid-associated protein n=1 Tax=Chryseobacterium sp. sg2396 TaxID=3276280 RepID=UPI002582D02F|nr:nucleoid-associated protein [uncultured Chryseobacterium sp.]
MQNITLGEINKFIVHYIGNKNNGDGVRFSDIHTDFDKIEEHIKQLANNSFKFDELYHFFFVPNLDLNPVYQFVSSIFKNKESFIEQSQNTGRYLYDKSTHPQIKSGELCVIYFNDCKVNDEIVDCIGIFKSENKDTVLKVNKRENGFELTDENGISTNKLDKGCLIFNAGKESGFLISVVDNTNRSSEAQYWKDEFLGIQPIKNDYHQTNEFLSIAKQFVTKQLDEEFKISKADKIDYLNRSVDYFKSHGSFDKQEFEELVFEDKGLIESFRTFDQAYRQENEIELYDNFDISTQAVKKQARVFKNVLKLDKNFHIYIHGNADLITQGIDENGRKYYKIFYEEEN